MQHASKLTIVQRMLQLQVQLLREYEIEIDYENQQRAIVALEVKKQLIRMLKALEAHFDLFKEPDTQQDK